MKGVPVPLVRAQQWTIVLMVLAGLVLRQPLFTTALLVVLLAGLIGGTHANLVHTAVRAVVAPDRLAAAVKEDGAQQRFNQTIAVTLLAAAQVIFYLLGHALWGWILAAAVAAAAAVALAGFCVGCFIHYQLRMLRHRLQKAA